MPIKIADSQKQLLEISRHLSWLGVTDGSKKEIFGMISKYTELLKKEMSMNPLTKTERGNV